MQKSSLEIISIWMVREITFCSSSCFRAVLTLISVRMTLTMMMILLETESDENFTPIYLKDT